MRFTSLFVALFAALLFSVTVVPAAAQDEAIAIPEVNIAITEDGFTVPETLPVGIVHLVYDNQLDTPVYPDFVMVNEGETSAGVLETLATNPEEALSLVTMMGSTELAPETTTTITYDLHPGEYLMLHFSETSPEPEIYQFTVEASDGTDANATAEAGATAEANATVEAGATEETGATAEAGIEADVTASMADFAFALPTSLEAGTKLWKIENLGTQWHEMLIAPVDEGTTVDEAKAMVMDALMAENPEDAALIPTFSWSPMGAGHRAWVNVDLEPGTYVVACTLPDLMSDSGASHLDHGMIKILTVK